MNRPTFVTMSTLAITLVAYFALTQAAHADMTLDLRGWSPETVGTAAQALSLSSDHPTGASLRR
jgi:hypothetical protein